MNKKIIEIIENSNKVKEQILHNSEKIQKITDVVGAVTNAFKNQNKVLFCGNGGSAADAQHLAAEFSGRFYKDRKALPSEALHCNTSYLTAVGNDYGYEYIYSRLIEGIGNKGDILFGISTSGNSKNIVNAFKVAQEIGLITIAMVGEKQCEMNKYSNFILSVPSTDTPRIQESHILIGHIICELVEENLF
jgi:D-sedoheptulose 7-phosphate isomerase